MMERAVEMTPEQVVRWRATVMPFLERICKLQSEVTDRHLGWDESTDCICGTGGYWYIQDDFIYPGAGEFRGFRNTGKALDFIEEAVREKLDRLDVEHKGEQR